MTKTIKETQRAPETMSHSLRYLKNPGEKECSDTFLGGKKEPMLVTGLGFINKQLRFVVCAHISG